MSPLLASSLASRFEGVVGPEYVHVAQAELQKYQVDGATPAVALQPETPGQAADIVRIAAEEKLSIVPCGSCSALAIGNVPSRYDLALDMTRISGIAHYDPGDLTVSVNGGTLLAELAQILAEKNQFLPLAVPFFSRATVAGAIASGLDSPLRHSYGTPRDFLIGAEFIDGTGAQAKSGGRVVKNVTGYDFHKLLHGSLGSLAVITRLNFRTFPLPPSRRGFLVSFADETAALAFVNALAASFLTPTVLEVMSPEFARLFLEEKSPVASLRLDSQAWTVCVGFEGTGEVCERYGRDLASLACTAAAQNAVMIHDAQFLAMLEILGEAPASMHSASGQSIVFRFATLPAQLPDLLRALRSFANSSWMPPVILIRSASIVYLALLPREAEESALKQVAYFCNSVGSLRGKLEFNPSLLFCPPEWKSALNFSAQPPADFDLHRRIKKAFDPNGTLAPGRFVGGI